MELVRNVFFNTDKLIRDETVKISYTGELYQRDCQTAYLHFTFGNDWTQKIDLPMKRTSLGFQTEITIPSDAESLDLAFRDDQGNWDNNNKQNYSFQISPRPFALMVIDQQDMVFEKPVSGVQKFFRKVIMNIKRTAKFLPRVLGFGYDSEKDSSF